MDGQMACRLYRVRVEEHALLAADRTDLTDGLDASDLIIGIHHGNKAGILPNCVTHLLGKNDPVFVNVQKGDGKALLLQLVQGVQDGVMLEGRGDDMPFPFSCAQPCGGENGLIVGLAAAGGEGDLRCRAAETVCNALRCVGQRLRSGLTGRMQAGGVSINGIHVRQHGMDSRLTHFCCGAIIQIDPHT